MLWLVKDSWRAPRPSTSESPFRIKLPNMCFSTGCGQSGSTVYCCLDILTGEMVALSEWNFKSQLGQKRSAHDKSKIEDEKFLKQVITSTVIKKLILIKPINIFRFQAISELLIRCRKRMDRVLFLRRPHSLATFTTVVLSKLTGVQHRTRNKLVDNKGQSS